MGERTRPSANLVVKQSALIHPDWTTRDHRSYLEFDEGFSHNFVQELPVHQWLTDPEHPGYVWHTEHCYKAGCTCGTESVTIDHPGNDKSYREVEEDARDNVEYAGFVILEGRSGGAPQPIEHEISTEHGHTITFAVKRDLRSDGFKMDRYAADLEEAVKNAQAALEATRAARRVTSDHGARDRLGDLADTLQSVLEGNPQAAGLEIFATTARKAADARRANA